MIRLKDAESNFFGLERSFVLADHQKNRLTTKERVKSCLGENGVHLTTQELDFLFNSVAKGQTSTNYLDLIAFCRGQMSKQREGEVERLFNRLDQRRNQEIHADALLSRFKPQQHPEVKMEGKNPALVKDAFCDSLNLFGKLGVGQSKLRATTYRTV